MKIASKDSQKIIKKPIQIKLKPTSVNNGNLAQTSNPNMLPCFLLLKSPNGNQPIKQPITIASNAIGQNNLGVKVVSQSQLKKFQDTAIPVVQQPQSSCSSATGDFFDTQFF